MKKHSKRYQQTKAKLDQSRHKVSGTPAYPLDEALTLLKGFAGVKFDQTVEVAINLGIDPKRSDQLVRGSVSLPHGIGVTRKVIVFATGDEAKVARQAGADEAGGEELIKRVTEGWTDFDVAITVPAMMKLVSKLGRILGPQGKMPSPKTGTVTQDIARVVKEYKAGKVEYRTDAGGVVHAPVGKLSFQGLALKENIETFLEYLKSNRPASAKGTFMRKVTLSATMSPGLTLKI